MIYLTEKSANCDARLLIGGKSASVVTKTFHSQLETPFLVSFQEII